MDTDCFVIHILTEDFYEDISDGVARWFDTFNYNENDKRLLTIGKNKKVIGLFKDELEGKIMQEFCALRAKTYAYLINGYNDNDYDKEKIIDKKAKGTKKCVIKRRLMFENYKDYLFNNTVILRWQQRFKSDYHEVYSEEVNKAEMMIRDWKYLIELQHIHTEQMLLKCVKVKWWWWKIYSLKNLQWNSVTSTVNINDQFWWLYKWK